MIDHEGLRPEEAEALSGRVPQTRVEILDRGRLFVAVLVADRGGDGMQTFRLVATPERLLTLYHGPLPSVDEVRAKLGRGQGPRDVPEMIAMLIEVGVTQIERSLLTLDSQMGDVEAVADDEPRAALEQLRPLRREAARLRRGLVRRREVDARLAEVAPPWLCEGDPKRWRDIASHNADLADAAAATLERTHGLSEYLQGRLATVLNDRLYLLTLISAILLPLSLITSLLGVNVGGIPFTRQRWAFPMLCLVLAAIGLAGYRFALSRAWLPGARGRRWLLGRAREMISGKSG